MDYEAINGFPIFEIILLVGVAVVLFALLFILLRRTNLGEIKDETLQQQKALLYDLLKIKKDADEHKVLLSSLNELISKTKVAMDEKDVARVEKMIDEPNS